MAMRLFGLAFGPHATAYLDRMSPGKIRAQIVKKARTLLLEPHPPGSVKLHGITSDGDEAVYRVRSGDYRILYVVKTKPHSLVTVIDVDDRKDVYR
jgi:mRNA-degrading endonuclease RelE of RelBE toxin-antitoxin system